MFIDRAIGGRKLGVKPWCYTKKASKRWEYCNIAVCPSGNETTNAEGEPVPPPTPREPPANKGNTPRIYTCIINKL